MTFNPDDFVFKSLRVPEDNPTVLEYDATQKFILIRHKNEGTQELDYQACQLSTELNDHLLNNIPDEYSNRNDRILLFYIRKDGTYRLEKEKLKYNFQTKESSWVRYEYKELTLEQAKELFEAIKATAWAQDVTTAVKIRNESLELAKKRPYLDKMHLDRLQLQQKTLRNTDWRILDDAPQEYEGEIDNWRLFRRKLREIVKSPDMFEDELDYLLYNADFRWPMSPYQWHINYPDSPASEYLQDDAHWSVSLDSHIGNEKLNDIQRDINNVLKAAIENELPEGFGGTPENELLIRLAKKYKLLADIPEINTIISES